MALSAIPVYFSNDIAAVVALETITLEPIGMFFVLEHNIRLGLANKDDFIIGRVDGACLTRRRGAGSVGASRQHKKNCNTQNYNDVFHMSIFHITLIIQKHVSIMVEYTIPTFEIRLYCRV
jgi:hypothetical protein